MIRLLILLSLLLSGCSLGWNATFVPPHNEPIVGNYVARYRAQLEPSIKSGRFEYEGLYSVWGLQRWQNSETVGHFPESWERSDWTIERYHVDFEHKATYWLHKEYFGVYTEYFHPLDDDAGDKSRTDYYWLTGFRGRFF